jgi:hypothetical protein
MQSDLFGYVVRIWLLAILDVAGNMLESRSGRTPNLRRFRMLGGMGRDRRG